MSLADEIDRLAAQHAAGRLSDAEFEAAKARVIAQQHVDPTLGHDAYRDGHPDATMAAVGSLRRSVSDRWIGGVCGGLSKLTGMDSWIIRLLFTVAILFGGFGLIPYILLWIFVPAER